jgi:uncharacterized protein YrzB (UPF0473 family)
MNERNLKKITVKKMDGTMEEMKLINSFGINDINKSFVILSKDEVDSDGLSKIYVSEIIEETPGVYNLIGITDDTIWEKVKQAMKEIAQG